MEKKPARRKINKTGEAPKLSKRERRKKFHKWIDMDMLRKTSGKTNFYGGWGEKPEWFCDGCGVRVHFAKIISGKMYCADCISEGKHKGE